MRPTQRSVTRRVMAAKGAPSYRETRLFERTEVPFLLDDLGARYKDFTVLHYRSHDYQLPLLAANEHYRCRALQ